jgi:hypothetical protein
MLSGPLTLQMAVTTLGVTVSCNVKLRYVLFYKSFQVNLPIFAQIYRKFTFLKILYIYSFSDFTKMYNH